MKQLAPTGTLPKWCAVPLAAKSQTFSHGLGQKQTSQAQPNRENPANRSDSTGNAAYSMARVQRPKRVLVIKRGWIHLSQNVSGSNNTTNTNPGQKPGLSHWPQSE
jgi:hypothetical protein